MGSVGAKKSGVAEYVKFSKSPSSFYTNEQDKHYSDETVSNYADWKDSLYPQQEQAITYFTGSGFIPLNKEMYNTEKYDDMSGTTKQQAFQLQKALNMFELKEPAVFMRATDFSRLGLNSGNDLKNLEGTTKVFDGFMSSSAANEPAFNGDVWLEIKTPAGKGIGAWVGGISQHKSETEFLFNCGSALKFGKSRYENGQWKIECELVGRSSKVPEVGKKKSK